MKTNKSAVFDTNILIDYSNGVEDAARIIRSCPDRIISSVTFIEFMVGIDFTKMDRAAAFLKSNFDILYPDEEVTDIAIHIRREMRLKLPDALIYATAKHLSFPLITRNTRDFDEQQSDIHIPYKI